MQAVDDDKALGMKVMKLSRMLRLRFDRRVVPLGLTRAQWQTIACVRRRPGATQREVAGLLEVGEVTVGRSIDKLVEAGWVERRADPADRRAHRIWLTPAIEPLIGQFRTGGIDGTGVHEPLHAEPANVDRRGQRHTHFGGHSGEVVPGAVAGIVPAQRGVAAEQRLLVGRQRMVHLARADAQREDRRPDQADIAARIADPAPQR